MKRVLLGDAAEQLGQVDSDSVQCVVTSPPYWQQREYGDDPREIGREKTLFCRSGTCGDCYLCHLVRVFREVRRVLRPDGLLWLNLGDKAVNGWMMAVPQRVLLALVDTVGFGFGQEVAWCKTSSMPGGAPNRCNQAHEPVYMLGKGRHYYYDDEALRVAETEETRNKAINPATVKYKKKYSGRDDEDLKGNANSTVDRGDGTAKRRSFWLVNQSTAKDNLHVAPMPTQLSNDCVRASTSPRGACRVCGRPWGRVVSKTKTRRPRPRDFGKRTGAKGTGNVCPNTADKTITNTLGFYPLCRCDNLPALEDEPRYGDPINPTPSEVLRHQDWAKSTKAVLATASLVDTRHCVVLDPFSGSGTTGASALRNHCDFVGIELYPRMVEASLRVMVAADSRAKPAKRMSASSPGE